MRMRRPGGGVVGSLMLAAACWGFATVMSKAALAHVPPLTLLVVQLAGSVVFLWAIVALQRVRVRLDKTTAQLGLIGVLNPGIAYTFSLLGLALTTASMSTLIWITEPILILALAWLLLAERLRPPLLAFSALAVVGVVLVAGLDASAHSGGSPLGNGLILAGVLCCALYTILTRRTAARIDPLVVAALQQTAAFAWAVLIWPIELFHAGDHAAISPGTWAWAVVAGVLYYALAFWFYIDGLKRAPASLAGLFLNLIPIFGVSGAYVFLGERLAPAQWAGAIMILASVAGIVCWPSAEAVPAS